MITPQKVREARTSLEGVIRETPLIPSAHFSGVTGCRVFLKLENLQRTGSFKIRGAYYKISRLSEDDRERGVVAASAGNHAQGVACASQICGIRAWIVMPESTPLIKMRSTREYGAEVRLFGADFDESLSYALKLQEEMGLKLIHSYDDPEVITGQATVGLEILEDLEDLDAVLVPVGGGGLISGVAALVKRMRPGVRIIGVEAEGAPSMNRSRREGRIVKLDSVRTIADGIATKSVGEITFAMVQEYVDDLVTVEDDEIASAILDLMEREKIVVEGAGAAPLAALLFGKVSLRRRNVALVMSGGNIDVNIVERVIAKGLEKRKRLLRISVEVPDLPGALSGLTEIIAETRANVLQVMHDRLDEGVPLGFAKVEIDLETRGYDHADQIMRSLEDSGYKVKLNR